MTWAWLWPERTERTLVGRFYLSVWLHELTHLAMPFQVLLIVRYAGDSALGWVLFVEQLVAILAEIPTGAWADRYGRRASVLAGHAVAAVGWWSIPLATLAPDRWRAEALCAAFGLLGVGMALVSGAIESWVVDHLHAQHRRDLVATFFGRERSLASAGGIMADVLVLAAAAWVDFRWFFVVTGFGELVALAVLWPQPESDASLDVNSLDGVEEVADNDHDSSRQSILATAEQGFRAITSSRALLVLAGLTVWSTIAFGSAAEGIQAAFHDVLPDRAHATKQTEISFAGLELASDLLGVVAPLVAVGWARRWGSHSLLAVAIAVPALAATSLWWTGSVLQVATIFLLATAGHHMYQTVADEVRHRFLPARSRATAASALNLLDSLATLVGTAWLGWLLGALSTTTAVVVMGLATLPAGVLAAILAIKSSPDTAAESS